MAISFKQLDRIFRDALGNSLEYLVEPDYRSIAVGIPTKLYRNPEGDPIVVVATQLSEDGRFVEFFTPKLYSLAGCPHVSAVTRVMLGACWRTGAVQFELDEADGEVRATAEYILADGTLTKAQVRETCAQLIGVVDAFHDVIGGAMETGKVAFPEEPDFESILPTAPAMPGSLPTDVKTEEVLRDMVIKALKIGVERWKAATPSDEIIRRW